jgi:hypothetical protein
LLVQHQGSLATERKRPIPASPASRRRQRSHWQHAESAHLCFAFRRRSTARVITALCHA